MIGQFVDLFDQRKYGFNYLAAIGFFLGGVAGWFLWFLSNVVLDRGVQFGFSIGSFGQIILINLVFAFVFVGLCHIIKRDIFLPFAAGLAQIILGILYRSIGLYGAQVFNFHSIMMNFIWSFFMAGSLILFFRSIGMKPLSFLLGFVVGSILGDFFQLVFFSPPMGFFIRMLLIQVAEALITGFLFYKGLSIHLKKREIPLKAAYSVVTTQDLAVKYFGNEAGMTGAGVVAVGKFRKVAINPFKVRGKYRGKGSMRVDEQGVKLFGRHVFSLAARFGIGAVIFFGSLIITTALTGGAAYFAPGLIPLYFLMEYGILKRENISIPFSALKSYVVDPKDNLIAISFEGSTWCTPAVLNTENWRNILRALREKAPQLDSNPKITLD